MRLEELLTKIHDYTVGTIYAEAPFTTESDAYVLVGTEEQRESFVDDVAEHNVNIEPVMEVEDAKNLIAELEGNIALLIDVLNDEDIEDDED